MVEKRPFVSFQPEAWLEIEKIKPHPKNPRVDLKKNKKRFSSLIDSLNRGLFEPLKISKLSGCCLGGHQRLEALKTLGYIEAPVMFIECKDEKEEIEIMVKDNNGWGEFDRLKMTQLMEELEYSLSLGFTDAELKNFGDELLLDAQLPNVEIPVQNTTEIVIQFEDEKDAIKLFEELIKKGYSCRILKS